MNDAHEHIANVGSMLCFVEKGILAVEHRALERLFANIMPTAGLCRVGI